MDDIYQSAPVPLGSRSIRVLDLEAHSESEKLCGTLRVIRLSENPKFTTISYVWGSGTSEISVNGHGLAITENCYNALTALRSQYGVLTIWVDSICINQQDEAEKSDQIPLTEEIYAWAETVYIWFGNGSDRSYAAMECLLMVPKKFQCLWLTRWAADPSIKARVPAALYAFLRVLGYYSRCIPLRRGLTKKFMRAYRFDDLDDLLCQDWLNRGWTYQEIILACNPVIVCGNKSMTWDNFIRGIEYLLVIKDCYVDSMDTTTTWASVMENQMRAVEFIRTPDVSTAMTNMINTRDSGDPFRIPQQCNIWRSIFTTWMNLNRPTRWNAKQKRRSVNTVVCRCGERETGSSFHLYQWWAHLRLRLVGTLCLGCSFLTGIACFVILKGIHTTTTTVAGGTLVDVGGLLIFFSISIFFFTWKFRVGPVTLFLVGNQSKCTKSKSVPATSVSVYRALRSRIVSRPKDQSYAFHGVLKSLEIELTAPDYAKSVGQIYGDLFNDLLKSGWSLNLLLDAGLPGFEDSPSWTPNWNLASTKDWLDEGYVYGEDEIKLTATPASRAIHVFNDEGTLSIWGSWQGSIVFCSGQLHEVSDNRKTDATWYLAHLQNIRSLICVISAFRAQGRIVGRDETLSKGIFELLQARISSRIGLEYQKGFNAWYTIMTNTISASDDLNEQVTMCYSSLAKDSSAVSYYYQICANLANKRVLFVTSTGDVGTGSQYIALRDNVYLVSGVTMPLVLRNAQDEQHRIVSPAFVYGMMKGEKWYGSLEGEIKLAKSPFTRITGLSAGAQESSILPCCTDTSFCSLRKGKAKIEEPESTGSSSIAASSTSTAAEELAEGIQDRLPVITEYKTDEFSAKIGQALEDYRGRQPEHTDLTNEELQIKMMTDPECIEALEQQKVNRRQREQSENAEEKQTKREKHEPVKIEQTLEDYRHKHPEYAELNAEELLVKMMTDPECIEMLEQEKRERPKRREERELEEKQKKREKHESQNIKQTLKDYRRRLLAYAAMSDEELQIKMMSDPDFIELLEREKRERKERRAKWRGTEKQKEREEYERDNITLDKSEPGETTSEPPEQVDAIAFSSRSHHIPRSDLEPAVTTTEPPDSFDAITSSSKLGDNSLNQLEHAETNVNAMASSPDTNDTSSRKLKHAETKTESPEETITTAPSSSKS